MIIMLSLNVLYVERGRNVYHTKGMSIYLEQLINPNNNGK